MSEDEEIEELERTVRTEAEEAERQDAVVEFIRQFHKFLESVEESGG